MRIQKILIMMLIVILGLTGCNNNDLETSQNDNKHSAETSNKQDEVTDNSNEINDSSDLLYKEYQIGANMGDGKVICFKQVIEDNTENPQAIVVYCDDSVKEIIPYEEKDIEYEIEEAGTYAFFVIEEDKSLVDISGQVSDFIDADERELLPLK